jgi:hypothetical protein
MADWQLEVSFFSFSGTSLEVLRELLRASLTLIGMAIFTRID